MPFLLPTIRSASEFHRIVPEYSGLRAIPPVGNCPPPQRQISAHYDSINKAKIQGQPKVSQLQDSKCILFSAKQGNLVGFAHAVKAAMVTEDFYVGLGYAGTTAQVFDTGEDAVLSGLDNALRCL